MVVPILNMYNDDKIDHFCFILIRFIPARTTTYNRQYYKL